MLLRTFSTHLKVVARDAKEMRNTQDTRPGCVSCKSWRFYLFFVKKMIRFSTDYNIFLVTFVRSMRMLLFLPHDRSDRTFYSQTGQFSKHQKLLLQDVRFGAWVLKNPLIGKDHQ